MSCNRVVFITCALALIFSYSAHSQILGPYGSGSIVFEVDGNGLLSSTGTYGTGTLSSGLAGAGTRLIWYPGKASFRAGNVSGSDWSDSNIGAYSTALGQDDLASGLYSFAVGSGNTASNVGSVSLGIGSTASGFNGIALGSQVVASGSNSFAEGMYSQATNGYSIALGFLAISTGNGSIALGETITASGQSAVALGVDNMSSGNDSFSAGYGNTASGLSSAAFNGCTTANSSYSTAFGTYNKGLSETGGTPNLGSWNGTDPLFEIGNGTSSTAKSDALVVYKDGTVAVHATLRCASAGDLSMGSFTAGTAP